MDRSETSDLIWWLMVSSRLVPSGSEGKKVMKAIFVEMGWIFIELQQLYLRLPSTYSPANPRDPVYPVIRYLTQQLCT